jgi:hypothetical protein
MRRSLRRRFAKAPYSRREALGVKQKRWYYDNAG